MPQDELRIALGHTSSKCGPHAFFREVFWQISTQGARALYPGNPELWILGRGQVVLHFSAA